MSLALGRWRRFSAAQISFLLLVASVPFMRPLNASLFGMVVTAADALFLITLVLAGLAWWRSDREVRVGRFAVLVLVYLAALVVSVGFAADPARGAVKLVANLYLAALGLLAYHMARQDGVLRTAAAAWGLATAVTAVAMVAGAVLFFFGLQDRSLNPVLWDHGSLPPGPYPRLVGFFLNANMACSYLAIGLLLIAALALPQGRWSRPAATLLLVVLVAVLSTLSPGVGGALLALGLGSWLVLRARGAAINGVMALAAGVLAACLLLAVTAVYPDLDVLREEARLVLEPSPRLLIWQDALERILDQPLIGRGLGAAVADVSYVTPSGVWQHHADGHNVWLNLAGQSGLLGVAAFALLVAHLIGGLRGRWLPEDSRTVLRGGLALGLVAVLYHSLSLSLEETRHVWLLFGLLAAAIDDETQLPVQTGLRFSMKARRPSA